MISPLRSHNAPCSSEGNRPRVPTSGRIVRRPARARRDESIPYDRTWPRHRLPLPLRCSSLPWTPLMGAKSRRKGQAGEREVFGLLSDLLGAVVKRNVNARAGDCDTARPARPVLFYHASRRPWAAMVRPGRRRNRDSARPASRRAEGFTRACYSVLSREPGSARAPWPRIFFRDDPRQFDLGEGGGRGNDFGEVSPY